MSTVPAGRNPHPWQPQPVGALLVAGRQYETAQQAEPGADYWVGLEGGLELLDEQMLASAWMVIRGRNGRQGEARTPTLPLPPDIRRLVLGGMELGEANDRLFDTHNSKQAGGAFGLLTGNRFTRGGVYAQAVSLALIPLVHPLWET